MPWRHPHILPPFRDSSVVIGADVVLALWKRGEPKLSVLVRLRRLRILSVRSLQHHARAPYAFTPCVHDRAPDGSDSARFCAQARNQGSAEKSNQDPAHSHRCLRNQQLNPRPRSPQRSFAVKAASNVPLHGADQSTFRSLLNSAIDAPDVFFIFPLLVGRIALPRSVEFPS